MRYRATLPVTFETNYKRVGNLKSSPEEQAEQHVKAIEKYGYKVIEYTINPEVKLRNYRKVKQVEIDLTIEVVDAAEVNNYTETRILQLWKMISFFEWGTFRYSKISKIQ